MRSSKHPLFSEKGKIIGACYATPARPDPDRDSERWGDERKVPSIGVLLSLKAEGQEDQTAKVNGIEFNYLHWHGLYFDGSEERPTRSNHQTFWRTDRKDVSQAAFHTLWVACDNLVRRLCADPIWRARAEYDLCDAERERALEVTAEAETALQEAREEFARRVEACGVAAEQCRRVRKQYGIRD